MLPADAIALFIEAKMKKIAAKLALSAPPPALAGRVINYYYGAPPPTLLAAPVAPSGPVSSLPTILTDTDDDELVTLCFADLRGHTKWQKDAEVLHLIEATLLDKRYDLPSFLKLDITRWTEEWHYKEGLLLRI